MGEISRQSNLTHCVLALLIPWTRSFSVGGGDGWMCVVLSAIGFLAESFASTPQMTLPTSRYRQAKVSPDIGQCTKGLSGPPVENQCSNPSHTNKNASSSIIESYLFKCFNDDKMKNGVELIFRQTTVFQREQPEEIISKSH